MSLTNEAILNQFTKLAAHVTILSAIAGFTSASMAASTSAAFNVTVSVIQSCTVASQSLSSRHNNDFAAVRFEVLVKTSLACPVITAHAITPKTGAGIGATLANRQLTGPAATILMDRATSDAVHVSVLRDDSGGVVHKFSVDVGSTQPIPLRGRVPVEQAAMAGSHTDTLTVMLTY